MKVTTPLLAFLCLGLAAPAFAASKPNVLIILADDLGYSDLGCYGSEIHTPNLDALAADGLKYTQFYNTARCWPTRGALMSGYYAPQVSMDPPQGELPKWAVMFPKFLAPLGYHSYHSGKWHVQHVERIVADAGFEHSYYVTDYNNHFEAKKHKLDDEPLPPAGAAEGYYSTTAIADYAIKFLQGHQEQHPGEPFFCYTAFITPHFPIMAPASDIAKYEEIYEQGWVKTREARYQRQKAMGLINCELSTPEPQIRAPSGAPNVLDDLGDGETLYAVPWDTLTPAQKKFQAEKEAIHSAMVDRIDQEIGRVLAQVKAMGAMENTLILFLSDNGASAEVMVRGGGNDPHAAMGSEHSFLCLGPGGSTVSNTPFRRHKIWTHEGGISTPLIVHWPAGIAAKGELRHDVGHVVDILPTILDITGAARVPTPVPPPPFPGISLLPSFAKDNATSREYVFFSHQGNRALRMGDWKIVSAKIDADDWELYNLATDRSEMHNLATQEPARLKAMAAKWTALSDEFTKEGGPAGPKKKGKKNADE